MMPVWRSARTSVVPPGVSEACQGFGVGDGGAWRPEGEEGEGDVVVFGERAPSSARARALPTDATGIPVIRLLRINAAAKRGDCDPCYMIILVKFYLEAKVKVDLSWNLEEEEKTLPRMTWAGPLSTEQCMKEGYHREGFCYIGKAWELQEQAWDKEGIKVQRMGQQGSLKVLVIMEKKPVLNEMTPMLAEKVYSVRQEGFAKLANFLEWNLLETFG
ncbi:hypothetical protein BT96DRAFT_1080015 [Gymnopus androsaceus JB14]|uniref:Uncharacterized protein n=1 Tax=Gymnopus androsaceus JB14 TaxID=1447944 RepID=A0A6A4I3P1_9AGAR|nr:hypothetical protein BT96DRAFT_1080015 [Gymnopus androsaceus JB14]